MVLSVDRERELKLIAISLRKDIVRMVGIAESGHPGGSLSAVEIMVTLYWNYLRHKPQDPWWKERDRFVLSKGHATPLLYSVLASRGYFPREELWNFRRLGSILQGHPEYGKTPGVEATTGSLGQGLGVAVGMALASKLDGERWRVYVLLGDGELEEGSIWESAMSASFRRLNNLIAIVDNNDLQIDGRVSEIKGSVYPLREKWEAFGWCVIDVNGHDFKQLFEAFDKAIQSKDKPTVIIAHTVKGKGVSFMEDNVDFHGKAPTQEQVEEALRELNEQERLIREGKI